MMHTFAIPFGYLWLLIPFIAIGVGQLLLVRYRRKKRRTVRSPSYRKGVVGNRELEPTIYRLALKLGGRLTVSDVVLETGMSVKESEETLNAIMDGIRVGMEITDTGVVVYEFSELIGRSGS